MKSVFSLICTLITFSVFADGITPVYTAGGALSDISAQTALDPMLNTQKNGWWYTTSMLNDSQGLKHSLEVVLFRIPFFNSAIGGGSIGFTFQHAGQTLYLWNNYANQQMMTDFSVGKFTAIPAATGNYRISVSPFSIGNQDPGFLFELQHDPADTTHIAGQLNAKYLLTATGIAQVGAAQNKLQGVQYAFHATMVDDRGVMPEGYGGYVGPVPGQTVSPNVMASWELALPKLHLTSWTMHISPIDNTANNLIQKALTFSSATPTTDVMWLDRQVLYPSDSKNETRNVSGMTRLAQTKLNGSSSLNALLSNNNNAQQLYHGTWMSFCFNLGEYKGYCGAIVAFWNPFVTTAQMDSDTTAHGGFMNLFLPNDKGEKNAPQPGGVITESLSFVKGSQTTPYRIQNDPTRVFASPLSGNHYAQTVFVTLRKGTLINAALNHQHTTAKDITLQFNTLSKQTENVLLTNNDAFYEGAAVVSVCEDNNCVPMGTGFVEQMGYDQ